MDPSLYVPYLENVSKFFDGPITHKQLYFNFSALLIPKNTVNAIEYKKEEAIDRMKNDPKGIEVTQKLLELIKTSDFSSVQSSHGDNLNPTGAGASIGFDGLGRIENEQ